MHRTILFLFLFVSLISEVFADVVDSITAKRVANNFYYQNSESKSLEDISTKLVYISAANKDLADYYVFNVNKNDGYVIVSADNNINPILAYSLNGSINSNDMPPSFIYWMNNYKAQIQYTRLNSIKADERIKEKWNSCLTENKPKLKNNKSIVGPLLATKWGQGCYYNKLCPADTKGNCGHAYAGCVANAMSQIMRYWKFPSHGYGFHSIYDAQYGEMNVDFANTFYDWNNMPTTLSASSPENEINAVSTLIYQCGVSVDMDYDKAGSGVSTVDFVGDKMKEYFNYSRSMKIQKADWKTDWVEWKNMLMEELNSNRPILYSGLDDHANGGHGWVCDGYNDNEYFHFDWGWSGQLNGYFLITNLNPATYSFNSSQIILTGIQPNNIPDIHLNLYSDISQTPDTIRYSKDFKLDVNIINNDTSRFIGRFAAFMFDKTGRRYLIDSTLNYDTLNPSAHLKNIISFSSKGIPFAIPGSYKAAIYYHSVNGNWALVDSINFRNHKDVNIIGTKNNLKLASDIKLSGSCIIQNQNFTLSSKLYNCGNTFQGNISFVLYNETGDSITTLWSKQNASIESLKNDSVFTADLNTDLPPAKYLVAVESRCENGTSTLVDPGNYTNPVIIRIDYPALLPDKFEKNESEAKAYDLTPVFTTDNAVVSTEGSNIDHSIDIDFYKLDLPLGYSYTITVTMYDKDRSYNGKNFTTNMLFNYRDSSKYTQYYDDKKAAVIKMKDGGKVYFEVFAYTWGQTGTYMLDLNINRTLNDAVQDIKALSDDLKLYPIPANTLLNINIQNTVGKEVKLMLYNSLAELVYQNTTSVLPTSIDVSGLSNGIYLLDAICNNRIYRKKLIINK